MVIWTKSDQSKQYSEVSYNRASYGDFQWFTEIRQNELDKWKFDRMYFSILLKILVFQNFKFDHQNVFIGFYINFSGENNSGTYDTMDYYLIKTWFQNFKKLEFSRIW